MTKPILSIVTGTYERLQYLKLLVLSVRQQIPKGLSYEFVIVDAGSKDGTPEWCEKQPDIRLIQHGALLGAIKAFTDGGYAAQGEYVAILNDDVVVKPLSLIRAIAYLETHSSCAMVALADNRTSSVTGDGTEFRTEGLGVTLPDGSQSMRTYGQCCVVRKELGDQADWWHANDPIIGQSRVYGGDNALSAWLWEHGWTVDSVEGCAVYDLILRDALREHNGRTASNDSANYYARYPTVHIPAQTQVYPIPERLRFLHLPVYESGHPQAANREAGLTEAFADYGICLELDYLNTPHLDLPAIVAAWQPDLILTQMQGWGDKLTPQMLADMRKACPTTLIVNWNGDAHERGLIDSRVFDLLRHVDLQLVVNAKVLPKYQHEHIPADFWAVIYKEPIYPLPEMPAHDLLLQANWYDYRTDLFDVVYSLRSHGYDVGVYGNDRRAIASTHYDFAKQAALYANAKITIGDTFPDTEGFVSNRMFQALGAGAFMLQQYSLNLEKWTGLVNGVHYIQWSDLSDLVTKIVEWSAPEKAAERAKIAAAGQAFVRQNYSAEAQARKLLTQIIPAALQAKEYA